MKSFCEEICIEVIRNEEVFLSLIHQQKTDVYIYLKVNLF